MTGVGARERSRTDALLEMVHDAHFMDLAGDAPAYRGGNARCPSCASMMRAEVLPSAKVDVCDACGGLWIDWFDGEIPTVAAEAEAGRVARGERPSVNGAGGQMTDGAGGCPRCLRPLEPELFRYPDASEAELVNDVELLRCPECAGSFVPRSSARLLLDRIREPRTVTFWEALVERLKRLVVGARS